MLNRKIFTGLILFWGAALWAQRAQDTLAVTQYRQARQQLVLLRNEGDRIPLARLDTLRVAFVDPGGWAESDLAEALNRYLPTPVLRPTATESVETANAWVRKQLPAFDLFILGLRDYQPGGDSLAIDRRRLVIEELIRQAPVVPVVIGGKNILAGMPMLARAEGLIVAPPGPYGPSLAAQLIFGAVGAKSSLTRSLGPDFPAGAGLATPGGLRLRYSPPAVAGMNGTLLRDSIRAIVEEGIRAGAYPGAQVLVAKDGHVVFREAFGHHTYDSLRAVRITDIYDFASVTKITTGLAALMQLHGQGRFDLDAPLRQYFPGYGFRNSNKAELTFREMLAHHARLRPWIPYWRGTLRGNARYPWRKGWSDERLNDGRFRCRTFRRDSSERYPIRLTDDLWQHRQYKKQIYRAIRKSPLREQKAYVYSGLLFYLLPEMLADLTGTDYETYLKDNFYHRLGAYTLTYNPLRFYFPDRIVPTERDSFFRMTQLHGTVHDEGAAMMAGVSGNAGLFGTADDLAKLMTLYMNYGSYGGEQLIAEASVREFAACQYCEEGNHRGLGFDKPLIEYDPARSSVAKAAGPASFGHSGYTGTFAWADPEQGLLFIFLSNRVYPTRDNRRLYERNIRPRIHRVLYQAMDGG